MPKQDSPENRYYLETHPYVSFGDNGTTASLNAFGDIIQISQAHGSSRSGFFCVDQPEVPEPFSVQLRAEKIMNAREIDGEGVYAYTYTQDEDLHETLGMRHEFIHDRWPLFTTEYSHITYKVLHVAFQGTIFQQYVWSTKSSPINYSSGLDISVSANLRIRDLDFVDSSYNFNKEDFRQHCEHCEYCQDHEGLEHGEDCEGCKHCNRCERYSHRISEDGYGFILEHKGLFRSEKGEEKLESICLAISIFVNGVRQKLELKGSNGDPIIVINSQKFSVVQGHSLQVTVGYKVLSQDKDWNGIKHPITEDNLCAMHKMLGDTSFTRLEISRDAHIDFIMRRNMEHILSVCSIPMPHSFKKGKALTCGDMSGHRIVTSASL
jgi:hypothetical protein